MNLKRNKAKSERTREKAEASYIQERLKEVWLVRFKDPIDEIIVMGTSPSSAETHARIYITHAYKGLTPTISEVRLLGYLFDPYYYEHRW